MAHNLSGPLNANGNEIQNARLHNLAAAPSSPTFGRFYHNTTDGFVYVYDGTAFRQLVTLTQLLTIRLDQLAAPTGPLSLNGQRLINQADPINPQDSATKAYVDAAVTGLKWKDAVRAATTSTITKTGAQTVDGVAVVAGDRVAIMDGTAANTGLWLVAAGAWVRTVDADTASEVFGMTFFVSEGTSNGNKVFVMTTDAPITLGTTVLVFAQIGGGTTYSQGIGIVISGSTISVDVTIVARKFVGQIGTGAATAINVTHNLNTKAVTVGLRKVSTDEHWIPDVTSSTVNAVTLSFATAPASNEFEVVVIG